MGGQVSTFIPDALSCDAPPQAFLGDHRSSLPADSATMASGSSPASSTTLALQSPASPSALPLALALGAPQWPSRCELDWALLRAVAFVGVLCCTGSIRCVGCCASMSGPLAQELLWLQGLDRVGVAHC